MLDIKGCVHGAVSGLTRSTPTITRCVIFTAQVIAIQLRGQPAVDPTEKHDIHRYMRLFSPQQAAGRPSIIEHPPLVARRDGKRYKASITIGQQSTSGQIDFQ